MEAAPPPVEDRRAWRALAARIERGEGPEGWRLHRPGLAVYVAGALVFGAIGVTGFLLLLVEGLGLCPAIGAVLFVPLAGYCLASIALVPRSFLLLSPAWLYVGRALRAPLLVRWSDLEESDLRVATNARGTRETFGVVRLLLADGQEIKIDQFEIDHLRLVHREIEAFRQTHE